MCVVRCVDLVHPRGRSYVPVGLLEVIPQRLNDRPSAYRGRDDLETLMSSHSVRARAFGGALHTHMRVRPCDFISISCLE